MVLVFNSVCCRTSAVLQIPLQSMSKVSAFCEVNASEVNVTSVFWLLAPGEERKLVE